jgi:hypothetical protein
MAVHTQQAVPCVMEKGPTNWRQNRKAATASIDEPDPMNSF